MLSGRDAQLKHKDNFTFYKQMYFAVVVIQQINHRIQL
jgi:hypothetical protein